ncbi:MAG: biopolymer transporter ExbD [Comamonadaceae bacterium]|jgi:biopolymer transport protein TolR|nr:biopolymer transporter ExbD [Comamonadaceae bacterium]
MSFGRLERRPAQEPMSQINVTPLVDVMLVLLVIFMLTAPFLTGSLPLNLPRAPLGAQAKPAALSVLLELDRSGQALLNGLPVDGEQLAQRLKDVAVARPDAELQVRADRDAPYGRVVELLALANRAGIGRIGFVAESVPLKRAP